MNGSNNVSFDIRYYNKNHQIILSKHKYAQRIDSLVINGLTEQVEEFLVYAMFTEQQGRPGYRNYPELKKLIRRRIYLIKDYLDISQGTVRSLTQKGRREVTERVGVAAALMAINKVFNLNRADWQRIPETSKKLTMDFQIASNGNDFVAV